MLNIITIPGTRILHFFIHTIATLASFVDGAMDVKSRK